MAKLTAAEAEYSNAGREEQAAAVEEKRMLVALTGVIDTQGTDCPVASRRLMDFPETN